MNTIRTTPDVKLFVAAVREHLGDLTEEEREELVGGLEGDMSDLIEERGVEALPEPGEYAAELRSAAGFTPVAPPSRERDGAFARRLTGLLDSSHQRWQRFASGLPGQPWELLVALRPAWWVLRAWVALQAVDLVYGNGGSNYGLGPVPSLLGWGPALLVVAVVVSVQVGRGKLWPGTPGRGLLARVLLLVLNLVAVGFTPAALDGLITPAKAEMWANDAYYPETTASGQAGLSFNGEPVANVYPYDAQGRPLTGVQLVDRQGRRLAVTQDPYGEGTGWGEFYLVPWLNGRTQLFSVFPLGERTADQGTGEAIGDARVLTPPYASLPPVALAGTRPSVLLTPAQVAAQEKAAKKRAEARTRD